MVHLLAFSVFCYLITSSMTLSYQKIKLQYNSLLMHWYFNTLDMAEHLYGHKRLSFVYKHVELKNILKR